MLFRNSILLRRAVCANEFHCDKLQSNFQLLFIHHHGQSPPPFGAVAAGATPACGCGSGGILFPPHRLPSLGIHPIAPHLIPPGQCRLRRRLGSAGVGEPYPWQVPQFNESFYNQPVRRTGETCKNRGQLRTEAAKRHLVRSHDRQPICGRIFTQVIRGWPRGVIGGNTLPAQRIQRIDPRLKKHIADRLHFSKLRR